MPVTCKMMQLTAAKISRKGAVVPFVMRDFSAPGAARTVASGRWDEVDGTAGKAHATIDSAAIPCTAIAVRRGETHSSHPHATRYGRQWTPAWWCHVRGTWRTAAVAVAASDADGATLRVDTIRAMGA